ncbi:protein PSK SIMULATOR 2-like [Lotus japonicus]|uniref:protein PSK SIMULATOR 2-like n=1 Tax=Lotus japonicus TaxID=34305 RepID=UPI002584ABDF|nr:protein PSK SIMULATOR 2-like [Lotus japonicus]
MAPGGQGTNLCSCIFFYDEPDTLGILAFDAAKTMCRLLSLYKSLTETEINNLRCHVIISKGVAHLNSRDDCFLLNLACAERLEDLNLAAAAVSRLGLRTSDAVKSGAVDIKKLEFGTRNVGRVIEKTEKLVSATRKLHNALESLSEAEAAERKIQRWRHVRSSHGHGLKVKVESFNDRIVSLKRQVEHYKQNSLWGLTFDKVVGLMARIVFIVFARICSVFGSLISTGMPSREDPLALQHDSCRMENRDLYRMNLCLFEHVRNNNSVLKCNRTGVVRFPNRLPPLSRGGEVVKNNGVWRLAPASTVGGAGLSWRYANVILFVDRCMRCTVAIGEDARAAMYGLLPGRLKGKVRAKLRSEWLKWDKGLEGGKEVAERWYGSVGEVMEWLLPVAHDTVKWQGERNMEKQKFETKPTVLLLQTLHYSELEKVEEAIVEVLVGLSCIYWYRKQ